MIEMKDLWKFILALFGFGGVAMLATGAWSVPQSGVYSQLLPAQQWLYAGDTARCIWEIHPNTTKTINSVSYGAPGSWTSCTQNSTDFLLWNCSSVTVAEGNVTCPGIRVVQNEYPGTSETLDTENFTFKTASVKGSRFPGCTSADCTITSGASIPNGTYFMRNLKIDAALTLQGNTTITAMENFTIGTSGSITITTSSTPYTLNITTYRFLNQGTINGNGATGTNADCSNCPWYPGYCHVSSTQGGPAAIFYLQAANINNTGTVVFNGGKGGNAHACGYYTSEIYTCQYSANDASVGGRAGIFITNSTKSKITNTGSISFVGGEGGAALCQGNPCRICASANDGSIGGNLSIAATNFTSTNTISNNGGLGGAGASWGASCGNYGGGGNAGITKMSVVQNITITSTISSNGGAAGTSSGCGSKAAGSNQAANVSYCANGTGMNWTKFSPTSINSTTTCFFAPTTNFVVPNTSSNITAYLQNISVNVNRSTNITLLISFSKDNGTSWEWLSPDFYTLPFNSSNNATPYFDTHRQGSDYASYAKMRVIAFNNSSNIYGDPVEVTFNLTDMQANVTGVASPNGSISTNIILFSCNYTNSSSYMLEAATPYLLLDGSAYAMSFNSTSKLYYWNNNQTLLVGPHYWQCLADKANYKSALSTNTSFNITGFGIFYPTGYTSVKLTCPFPTINGMTPAGQKAGIGIFRIQNYNSTMLHNYSIFLNNTLPSGITLYARCDRFSPQLTGWNALSTDTGYKGLLNVNSTNSSAYCWLRMDCVSATPGTYTPFNYIFTEE